MKKGIELFRQQKADNEKKMLTATEKLAELKKKRVDMETRVNDAIADGDQVTAEKLIRARMDIDVQIEIAQKTLATFNKPIDRAAVAATWADDLSDYQKQIEKSEKELNQLIRQAAEKALSIADIINASWDARTAALRLVNDQEPYTYNAGNTDFPVVSFTGKTLKDVAELHSMDNMKSIRTDAAVTIGKALQDRSNTFFRKK